MKNKRGQMLIGLFLAVLIAVILFGVIVGFLNDNSISQNVVTAEDITIASSTGDTANSRVQDVSWFGNTTNQGTIGADVNFTTAGIITVDPDLWSDQDYQINYSYLPSSYVSNSNARTIVSLIPLILATVIIAALGVFTIMRN